MMLMGTAVSLLAAALKSGMQGFIRALISAKDRPAAAAAVVVRRKRRTLRCPLVFVDDLAREK
jgi:hypothetical protein